MAYGFVGGLTCMRRLATASNESAGDGEKRLWLTATAVSLPKHYRVFIVDI